MVVGPHGSYERCGSPCTLSPRMALAHSPLPDTPGAQHPLGRGIAPSQNGDVAVTCGMWRQVLSQALVHPAAMTKAHGRGWHTRKLHLPRSGGREAGEDPRPGPHSRFSSCPHGCCYQTNIPLHDRTQNIGAWSEERVIDGEGTKREDGDQRCLRSVLLAGLAWGS